MHTDRWPRKAGTVWRRSLKSAKRPAPKNQMRREGRTGECPHRPVDLRHEPRERGFAIQISVVRFEVKIPKKLLPRT